MFASNFIKIELTALNVQKIQAMTFIWHIILTHANANVLVLAKIANIPKSGINSQHAAVDVLNHLSATKINILIKDNANVNVYQNVVQLGQMSNVEDADLGLKVNDYFIN